MVTLNLPACLDDEKRDRLDGNFRTCLTIHPSRIRLWKKKELLINVVFDLIYPTIPYFLNLLNQVELLERGVRS